MTTNKEKILLVGDNPFHGISHLSQERSRQRSNSLTEADHAARLVMTSVDNGADGFMFSVGEETLSILEIIQRSGRIKDLKLYALVPYAYEYVRLAIQLGGITGLAKRLGKQIVFSRNLRAITKSFEGVVMMNPTKIMETYLVHEVHRIKSSAGDQANLECLLLHEIITDMALALDLHWLFTAFMQFTRESGVKPGFETRNFAYLVEKLRKWDVDISKTIIAAPFNKVGFQMNPSRKACEKTLENLPEPNTIAMSILAAGYIKPTEAIDYLENLANLKGTVVGVSKQQHACETFRLLKERFNV